MTTPCGRWTSTRLQPPRTAMTTTRDDDRTDGVRRCRPPRPQSRHPRPLNSSRCTSNHCGRTRSGPRTARWWTCRPGRRRDRRRNRHSTTACRSSGTVSSTTFPGTTTRNSRTTRATHAPAASVTWIRLASGGWSTTTRRPALGSCTERTTVTWASTLSPTTHVPRSDRAIVPPTTTDPVRQCIIIKAGVCYTLRNHSMNVVNRAVT